MIQCPRDRGTPPRRALMRIDHAGMRSVDGERGSSLLSVLAIGSLVVVLVTQSLLAAGRIQAATESAGDAAALAAGHAARYGDAIAAEAMISRLVPDADVRIDRDGTVVAVTVTLAVAVLGPEGLALTVDVTATARAVESPYRSGHA